MASLVTRNGIDVSPLDERTYETLVLSNALQVLVISDPKTEKAAAAMDVHVGHQSDPDHLPGLAHFLEHMLFLGTAKYPDEHSYKAFLSAHGGRSNASTSQTHTTYYFDVLSDHLADALDRFAQFFVAPLFTPSATERELQAVNAEHSKNLQNDARRLYQLQKSLSNPRHAFHKFGTGNLETLGTSPRQANVNVRAALLEFYATYYSASLMKLVIYGKEPLATLRGWAETLFATIPTSGRTCPSFGNEVPLDASRLARVVQVTPVKDLRIIDISWPLPSLHSDYLTKPTKILSHLIGHEGAGSILSYLKAHEWANGLSAGLCRDEEDWALFCVKVDVTEAGMEHVHDVVEVVYQYIHMLQRATPLDAWIFHETQDLARQNFRFKSKEEPIQYTSQLATGMHQYAPKYILTGSHLLYDIDADKVQQVLNLLTAPRMRLTVVSKTFEGTTECVEQWYHTPYSEAPIASSLLERWASPPRNMALELPRRNEFVCQDFRIVTPPSPVSGIPITSPLLLQEDETCRLWYKPDVDFRKPKLLLFFRLDSPALSTTPYHAVLTSLFVRYVKDTLTEMAYDAELAGMEYELGLHARALELFAGGYSEKLPILVSKVLDQMLAMTSATYPLDEAIFQRVKDRTKRMYENVYLEEPYQHAVHQCSQLLETSRWSVDDKLRAIEHVTSTDLAAHGHALFRQVFIEGFFYGNLALSAARPLMEQVVQSFGCGRAERGALPLLPSQRVHPRIVLLSEASEYRFQQRAWNQENVNSAICTLYQVGCDAQDETLATQARLELFAHVFKEPFFHQLRTQEQLGYLVFSGITRLEGVHYFRLLIQSNVASPRVLDARMERFLAHFRSVLTDMPRPTWAQHVRAVVQAQRERPKYEMDDAMRSWHEIARETFRFDRRERVAAIVATLQPRDLVQFFDACFAVRGLDRSKLSVWVYGASHPMVELTQDERTTSWTARSTTSTGLAAAMLVGRAAERPVEVIDEISTFRRAMPLFRATKSVSTRSQ